MSELDDIFFRRSVERLCHLADHLPETIELPELGEPQLTPADIDCFDEIRRITGELWRAHRDQLVARTS